MTTLQAAFRVATRALRAGVAFALNAYCIASGPSAITAIPGRIKSDVTV
jgi:hypothetical protein